MSKEPLKILEHDASGNLLATYVVSSTGTVHDRHDHERSILSSDRNVKRGVIGAKERIDIVVRGV